MSFQTDGTGSVLAAASLAETAVKSALAAIVGTYGIIKQLGLNKRQIVIAERAQGNANAYLALAQDAYDKITLPISTADQALFNNFTSSFGNYQTLYEQSAFNRTNPFVPDYVLQEGRAVSSAQRQFDRAALQRRRQRGKYETGRTTYDEIWFATMAQMARLDAVTHAYRFEEMRRRYYDNFFWKKNTNGIHVIDQMERDAVAALNHAQANVAAGLHSIAAAEHSQLIAAENVEATLANRASMWGGIANGAFRLAGQMSAGETMVDRIDRQGYGGWGAGTVTTRDTPAGPELVQ